MADRAKIGKRNKAKGSRAEQEYAKIFRDLGFSFCKTSRQASRLHDDAGIDLVEVPYNVQIKAGYAKGINYKTVLQTIKDRIVELFAPTHEVHSKPNIIIHRKDVGRGKKRDEYDDLVIMSFEDFKKIIENGSNSNTTEGD